MMVRENPDRPDGPGAVEDCAPAPYTDPKCATCRGTGKVGPYTNAEGIREMRPCRPCSMPVGVAVPPEGWAAGGWA